MKFLFLIILLLIYFLSPVIEQLWVEDYSSINFNTHESLLNIYGEPLKPCQNNKNDKRGSWDNRGYCSERGGGVHQICFNVNESTKDFSSSTKQSNWSESRLGNNHCMCLGAWALYKARQDAGDISQTQNELVCESIPEMALNSKYISNWNTWNGNELPQQIRNGVDSLYKQCYDKGNESQKKFLKDKYIKLLNEYNYKQEK